MFPEFRVLVFSFLALLLVWGVNVAQAETSSLPSASQAVGKSEGEKSADNPVNDMSSLSHEEIRRMAQQYAREELDDMHYLEPTFENVSRLYWAMGVFDPEENFDAINKYLLVNECEVFENYYHNDFEWSKIKEVTTEYLKENRRTFPRRFQFIRPIHFGRYDLEAEAFAVLDRDLRAGARRYDINAERENYLCGHKGSIDGYPDSVRMILNRPFQLLYVPVLKDAAYNYLARANRQQTEKYGAKSNFALGRLDRDLRGHSRVAFLRIRVRFVKYLGIVRTNLGYQSVEMFAVLEGFDVYEDQELRRLLFTTQH